MEEKNGKLSISVVSGKDGNSEEKKSFWHIDRKVLPFKAHFFLFIGGMAAILPYQSALGITKLGLTASNLAAACTAQQICIAISKPLVGYLADYFNKLKATITGLTILQAVFCFLMIMIPRTDLQIHHKLQPLDANHKYNLCNHSQEIKSISSYQLPNFDDAIFSQILECARRPEKSSECIMEHCTNEKLDSVQPMNISYRIVKKNCEDSAEELLSPRNYTIPHGLYTTSDIIFISQSLGGLQNVSIVCLHPKSVLLFQENFSYDIMKQYCYAVSKSTELSDLLLATSDCQKHKTNYPDNKQPLDNTILSSANFKSYHFWLFSTTLIISIVCISCIFTMSDTACYESIQGADYGRQRAWGAVSWGLIAPFAGYLNDYTGDYIASWCLMTLFCALQIWNLSKMDLVKPDLSQNIFKGLKTIFSSAEFLAFEAGVLMNGIFTGIIWFYLAWFIVGIGGNELVIGLAHTMQCFLGEVPIMFVSGWMIEKFGHFNLVTLALFSHAVRFLVYSYLHNPWWILSIEWLHGFTFASFYSAMTSFGKLNSSPGTEATTQSVLCTTYEALGAGLGCVIFGISFDHFGSHKTFFYAFFVCSAATLLNVLFTVLLRCKKGHVDVTEKVATSNGRY